VDSSAGYSKKEQNRKSSEANLSSFPGFQILNFLLPSRALIADTILLSIWNMEIGIARRKYIE